MFIRLEVRKIIIKKIREEKLGFPSMMAVCLRGDYPFYSLQNLRENGNSLPFQRFCSGMPPIYFPFVAFGWGERV